MILHRQVQDADAAFSQALAGQFWGDRYGGKQMTGEELGKAAQEHFKAMPA